MFVYECGWMDGWDGWMEGWWDRGMRGCKDGGQGTEERRDGGVEGWKD